MKKAFAEDSQAPSTACVTDLIVAELSQNKRLL